MYYLTQLWFYFISKLFIYYSLNNFVFCYSMFDIFIFQQSDKAALLFRQYNKDSLYDRISTRPFLNAVEKKWIAFQLLCALNQCHKLKVNILTFTINFN